MENIKEKVREQKEIIEILFCYLSSQRKKEEREEKTLEKIMNMIFQN